MKEKYMVDKNRNAVNFHATSIHNKMDTFIFNNRYIFVSMVENFGTSRLSCKDIELRLFPCIILRATKEEICHIHNITNNTLNKVIQKLCTKANISSISNFIYLFALYMIEQGYAYAEGISPKPSNDAKSKKRQRRNKSNRSVGNEHCYKGREDGF